MKATGMTRCPRCDRRFEDRLSAWEEELKRTFGQTTVYEWTQSYRQYQEYMTRTGDLHPIQEKVETDFKEDGSLLVRYEAVCVECDFKFKCELSPSVQ